MAHTHRHCAELTKGPETSLRRFFSSLRLAITPGRLHGTVRCIALHRSFRPLRLAIRLNASLNGTARTGQGVASGPVEERPK